MNKKTKTKIIFIIIFAILALFDIVSTYFALQTGATESNAIGSNLIVEYGNHGYILFYGYLVGCIVAFMMLIESIIYLYHKYNKITIDIKMYNFIYVFVSIFIASTQLLAIINNVGITLTK